ncbi:hypothetical protein D3C74_404380 [compost metagenome]
MVIAFNGFSGTVGYYCAKHVGHQVCSLLGEDLLRVSLMLVNHFSFGVCNFGNHIGIVEFATVSNRAIGIR